MGREDNVPRWDPTVWLVPNTRRHVGGAGVSAAALVHTSAWRGSGEWWAAAAGWRDDEAFGASGDGFPGGGGVLSRPYSEAGVLGR